jgi:ABC-type maltose transport system permease subunit
MNNKNNEFIKWFWNNIIIIPFLASCVMMFVCSIVGYSHESTGIAGGVTFFIMVILFMTLPAKEKMAKAIFEDLEKLELWVEDETYCSVDYSGPFKTDVQNTVELKDLGEFKELKKKWGVE